MLVSFSFYEAKVALTYFAEFYFYTVKGNVLRK